MKIVLLHIEYYKREKSFMFSLLSVYYHCACRPWRLFGFGKCYDAYNIMSDMYIYLEVCGKRFTKYLSK